MLNNFSLSGISHEVQFGKRGGRIRCINNTFELVNEAGELMPLRVASTDSGDSTVTKADLQNTILNLADSPIGNQVVSVIKDTLPDSNDFESNDGIVVNRATKTISILDNNNQPQVFLDKLTNDQTYWKGTDAKNIYVQTQDPALSGSVPEGSIWFRI